MILCQLPGNVCRSRQQAVTVLQQANGGLKKRHLGKPATLFATCGQYRIDRAFLVAAAADADMAGRQVGVAGQRVMG